MERVASASCLVEALVEAGTGVQAEEKQGTNVEEEREDCSKDSMWEVFLAKEQNRCIVVKV